MATLADITTLLDLELDDLQKEKYTEKYSKFVFTLNHEMNANQIKSLIVDDLGLFGAPALFVLEHIEFSHPDVFSAITALIDSEMKN
jgi:hypothetical protein